MKDAIDDPRVYLAAERTLLAWIRTGLAMMGFGFVVARFGLFLRELVMARGVAVPPAHGWSHWFGMALVLAGVMTNLIAARQHLHLIRRLRSGEAYRPSVRPLEVVLALALAALGVALTACLWVFGG